MEEVLLSAVSKEPSRSLLLLLLLLLLPPPPPPLFVVVVDGMAESRHASSEAAPAVLEATVSMDDAAHREPGARQ
jgi:hypothetical protein